TALEEPTQSLARSCRKEMTVPGGWITEQSRGNESLWPLLRATSIERVRWSRSFWSMCRLERFDVMSHAETAVRTKHDPGIAPEVEQGRPAWDVARLFPAQGHWTVRDYLRLEAARDNEFPLIELSR